MDGLQTDFTYGPSLGGVDSGVPHEEVTKRFGWLGLNLVELDPQDESRLRLFCRLAGAPLQFPVRGRGSKNEQLCEVARPT